MESQSTIQVCFHFSTLTDPLKLLKYEHDFNEEEVNKLIKRFDPDYITQELQTIPTESWRAGDVKYTDPITYRIWDCWEISSGYKAFRSLNEPLELVLNQVHPHALKIKEIIKKLGVSYSLICSVTTRDGYWPVAHVKKHLLRNIADLDLDLLITYYELPDCECCGLSSDVPDEERD